MIEATWGGAFTISCIAVAAFGTGWLWRNESADREHQQRQARRRAHRFTTQKESN